VHVNDERRWTVILSVRVERRRHQKHENQE
jgi:hypothetical protein